MPCLLLDRSTSAKLRDLLKTHGSFKSLEVQIRKIQKSSYGKCKQGQWVTKHYLAQAGWQWASRTKNLRKNPVHGEEEARLVLTDAFEAQDLTSHETELNGRVDVEESVLTRYPKP
ncbi:Khdc3 [Symbiodinium microadriaticum]|nr:Khdc3 [Symbiodinium microadriaticum]